MTGSQNIVLLGVGHTNAHVIHQWTRSPIPNYKLVAISQYPSATYSGMLPGVLSGQFGSAEMEIDLSRLLNRSHGELILDDVQKLHFDTQTLHFTKRSPIPFAILSIGVGSMPAGLPLNHSGLVVPTKPMQTFIDRIDQRFETLMNRATSPIRIAIVGGGAAAIEIVLCLQQRIHLLHPSTRCEFSIVTQAARIGNGLKSSTVRKLEKILANRHITVHCGTQVQSVTSNSIQTVDGKEIEVDLAIWSTHAVAPPIISRLGLPTDERGFVLTEPTLQSIGHENIFAVGDSGTIQTAPCPKAGVYAVRQSPVLWNNIRALIERKPLRRFIPQHDFLKLLNTGDQKALLEYKSISIHAKWCWWLKRWIDKSFITPFQQA